MSSCESCTSITLDGTTQYTITAPGSYILSNSPNQTINGGSFASPNTQLSIQASNVKLNLNQQVLTGSGALTSTTPPYNLPNNTQIDVSIGILIAPSLQNIEIFNGTLQSFSAFALVVNYSSETGYTTNVSLHNLTFQSCGTIVDPIATGVVFAQGLLSSSIHHCKFFNNIYGNLSLYGCAQMHVADIDSHGLTGGTFSTPSSMDLLNPIYRAYGVQAESMVFILGSYDTPLSANSLFERIRVSYVQSLSAIFGIYFSEDPSVGAATLVGNCNNIIRDCQIGDLIYPVADTSSLTITGSCEMRGIAIESGSSFNRIERCKVNNMFSAITTGMGFSSYSGNWNTQAAFNVYQTFGATWFVDCEASALNSSGWISTVPQPGIILGQYYPAQWPVAGWYIQGAQSNDVRLTRCHVTNVNAGALLNGLAGDPMNAVQGTPIAVGSQPSLAAGFLLECPYISFYTNQFVLEDCVSASVTGMPGSSDFLVANYGTTPESIAPVPGLSSWTVASVLFNPLCRQQRLPASHGVRGDAANLQPSAGFSLSAPGENIVLRDCVSQGHNGPGFAVWARYTAEYNPALNRQVLFQRCVSQGNQQEGFQVDAPWVQVSLHGCISQSNQKDGYKVGAQYVNLFDCSAEFNGKDGVEVHRFFNYTVAAVSGTPLASLDLYDGAFSVVSTGPNTLQLIPNTYAPSPATITIGGVTLTVPLGNTLGAGNYPFVSMGPRVLVLGETDGVNNGVYGLQLAGTTVNNSEGQPTSALVYAFQRVDPWIEGNTVNAGQQIGVEGGSVYVLQNTISVGTTVPVFQGPSSCVSR